MKKTTNGFGGLKELMLTNGVDPDTLPRRKSICERSTVRKLAPTHPNHSMSSESGPSQAMVLASARPGHVELTWPII